MSQNPRHDSAHRFRATLGVTAFSLMSQFVQTGSSNDLGESIRLQRVFVKLVEPENPARPAALRYLSTSLVARFELHRDLSDVTEAIQLTEEEWTLTKMDDPDRCEVLGHLALCLKARFDANGAKGDLENSIQLFRQVLATAPKRFAELHNLSYALASRSELNRSAYDLQEALQLGEEALSLVEARHPDRYTAFLNLGRVHSLRFNQDNVFDDLEKSSKFYREGLRLLPPGHPHRCTAMKSLASTLRARFQLRGDSSDINEAICLTRDSLKILDRQHAGRAAALMELSTNLSTRFYNTGEIDDLEDAIQVDQEALELCPPGHPQCESCLNRLALDLIKRFNHTSAKPDLDDAIQILRGALSFPASKEDVRHQCMTSLASALWTRFSQLSQAQDLEESIQLYREVDLASNYGPIDRSFLLSSFSQSVYARYRHRGEMTDLDDAIELARKGVGLLNGRSDQRKPQRLEILAMYLRARYQQSSDEADISESIQLYRDAMALLEQCQNASRCFVLQGLASALRTRFQKHGVTADIKECIALHREALESMAAGDPMRRRVMSDFGDSLFIRYSQQGQLEDLEEANILHQDAIKLMERDDPDRSLVLFCGANDYYLLFRRSRTAHDSRMALRLAEESLHTATPGITHRFRALLLFAQLHLDRDTPFFNSTIGLRRLCDALRYDYCNATMRFTEGIKFLELVNAMSASDIEDHDLALQAHIIVIRLLPRVAYFGLQIQSRLQVLQRAENLASATASYALSLAQPNLAVEALEEGRAVFWTQALRLRTQFDDVPSQFRDELLALSRQLETESYDAAEQTRAVRNKAELERAASLRRRQSERFESILDTIRQQEGFERFMIQETFTSLSVVAQKGPVVMLLASPTSCSAIVIKSSQDGIHVPLTSITLCRLLDLSQMLRGSNCRNRDYVADPRAMKKYIPNARPEATEADSVLGELWTNVVKVIFESLSLSPASGQSRPRLWWCLTGQFTFLPIHAAGIYTEVNQCCSDFVISSYTPTLSTLINARRTLVPVNRKSARMLLLAVPRPFAGAPLPSTIDEVQVIVDVVPPGICISVPELDHSSPNSFAGATVKTMLDNLPDANILHLACHGTQNSRNALESGFLMQDGMMDIAKLMPLSLPKAFLAFLSACETAKGDCTQADQTIHLAAAMMFAGFKSVVGTMWSMNDIDGPLVAKTVYEQLFAGDSEQLDPNVIPYALDAAVRELRKRGRHASRWAPYIHIGV